MTRTVFCNQLGKEAEALKSPPYPGELGQKIFNHISNEAWQGWIKHQTMLINEYRLNLTEPKAREFLEQEMEKYLFGDGSELPPDFNEVS